MKQCLLIILLGLLVWLCHVLYLIATFEPSEHDQSGQIVIELAIPPEDGTENCIETIQPSVGPGPAFTLGDC